MLHYAIEEWATYSADAEKLWPLHWAEVALDQSVIPLDVDWQRYAALDAAGQLHIVTARDGEGTLQGYTIHLVCGHLHYQHTLHAFLDIFWLHPSARRGLAGYQLLRRTRDTLKARGVVKQILGHKLHVHGQLGTLLTRLGYAPIEHVYSALL